MGAHHVHLAADMETAQQSAVCMLQDEKNSRRQMASAALGMA